MNTIANSILFAELSEALQRGRKAKIRLVGQSMFPFLRSERDVLSLSPIGNECLQIGDIVLFQYMGQNRLHRIVKIRRVGQ